MKCGGGAKHIEHMKGKGWCMLQTMQYWFTSDGVGMNVLGVFIFSESAIIIGKWPPFFK